MNFAQYTVQLARMLRSRDHRRGFSALELIVVFTVIFLLFALLIPATLKLRAKQQRIRCISHLSLVSSGYRVWATDHQEKFPWQITTNTAPPTSFQTVLGYYRAISNELSIPLFLTCPADTRKPARDWTNLSQTNVSYFISLDSSASLPQAFLAGDRNIMTNDVRIGPGIVKLGSEMNPGWDGVLHRFQGNCAVGDGSLQQMSSARLRQAWTNTGQSSMTWAVP